MDLYRRHVKALEKYHMHCLRCILRIPWEVRRTNVSLLKEEVLQSIEVIIAKSRCRWAEHLVRMEDTRLP